MTIESQPNLASKAWNRCIPRRDQVWAVILAAGESTRMGKHKALAEIGRKAFLARLLEIYEAAGVPFCVVLGTGHQAVMQQIDLQRVPILVNRHPEKGPLSSLRIALGRLGDTSALLLHPVDHPLVRPSTIRTLVESHRWTSSTILIPRHPRGKGHPVLFPSCFYPDLLRAPLEEGARWVVHRRPSRVHWVKVEDVGVLANLNTPLDVTRWASEPLTRRPGSHV